MQVRPSRIEAAGATRIGLPFSVEGKLRAAREKLVPRRSDDEAELDHAVLHEADRHAPAGEPEAEGLGAVDGINDPDALAWRVGRGLRLLAQERILRKGLGEPLADQQLGVEIRLAGEVLRPLVLDRQLVARVEIAKRRLACLSDEREPELVSSVH